MYSAAPQRPPTPPADRKNSLKNKKVPDREPIHLDNESKKPEMQPTVLSGRTELPDREPIQVKNTSISQNESKDLPVKPTVLTGRPRVPDRTTKKDETIIQNESKIPYIESHSEDHTATLKDLPFLNKDTPQPSAWNNEPAPNPFKETEASNKPIRDTVLTASHVNPNKDLSPDASPDLTPDLSTAKTALDHTTDHTSTDNTTLDRTPGNSITGDTSKTTLDKTPFDFTTGNTSTGNTTIPIDNEITALDRPTPIGFNTGNTTLDRTIDHTTTGNITGDTILDRTPIDSTMDNTAGKNIFDRTPIDSTLERTTDHTTTGNTILDRTPIGSVTDNTTTGNTILDRTSIDSITDNTTGKNTFDRTPIDSTTDNITTGNTILDRTPIDSTIDNNIGKTGLDHTPIDTGNSIIDRTTDNTTIDHTNDHSKTRTPGSRTHQTTSRQRNEITRRIETEILTILEWHNPIRSGLIFGFSLSFIILSRWYSLLQIASSLLCITTGINLFYVNFILRSQRIVTNQNVSHPYSDLIHNERRNMIDRSSVTRYANFLSDISETIVRALTRIIFVERTTTSIKWMLIFFAIWKVSAHTSTMNIVLITLISAFIFPRLYISNKDIVDAHIHKGQTVIQRGIDKASTACSDAVNHSYTKSRFMVAKVGTTGTDAKNTIQKTSVALKDDNTTGNATRGHTATGNTSLDNTTFGNTTLDRTTGNSLDHTASLDRTTTTSIDRNPFDTTTDKNTFDHTTTGNNTRGSSITNSQGTRRYQTSSRQRNDTTRRIEREVLSILQWENPLRSGLIFAFFTGFIVLSRWYSLLQITSSILCITTGINLFYVNFILKSQKIITNQEVSHPYSNVIHNESRTMIDRSIVTRYANFLSDVSETVVRALTRIIFVERTSTSLKWMLIFFATWKVSAHISTMNIILIAGISAFIFPRLYISNKDIVDAHIQKGETMIQMGIDKASSTATEVVNNSYTKSRFMFAKVGTTGTDAKNTMQKTSCALKED